MTQRMWGSGGSPSLLARPVELDEVARTGLAHDAVATLHLPDQIAQHGRRQPRVGDHGREQMREALVVIELYLLRVDQYEPDLVRRGMHQDRAQDRVDASRLARPGRAGDQYMRHRGQVGADALAGHVLAQPGEERRGALGPLAVDVAEADEAAPRVRDLDPDRLLSGDRGENPDVGGGECVGEVVLELRHLADLRSRRELELVAAHVRPRDNAEQPGFDPEVLQRLEQRLGNGLAVASVGPGVGLAVLERLRGRRRVLDLLRGGDPLGLAHVPHRGRPVGPGLGRRGRVGLRLARRRGAGVAEGVLVLLDLSPVVIGSVVDLGLLHRPFQRLGCERLGLVRARDRDVVAFGVAPRRRARNLEALRADRAGDVAGARSRAADRLPRPAHQLRDCGPGEQEGPGEEHQHGEDVGAELLEEVGRGPIERLARGPTVRRQ